MSDMIDGIECAGVFSDIKKTGSDPAHAKPDLGLIFFKEEMHVSALYTKNRVKAAHILYNNKIGDHPARAVLANSGCANACTGKEGIEDLKLIGGKLAGLLGVEREEVLFASTGVIGKR